MTKKPKIYDYFVLVYQPSHRRAFPNGYVPEQIIVVEKILKRQLSPDEDVRHINGDTQDNRPENLEIISANNGYKVQLVGDNSLQEVRKTTSKTFIPCKFQRPCWKEVREPIARQNKIYLPYICSFQMEGDIYHCSHFWKFLDKSMEEERRKSVDDK